MNRIKIYWFIGLFLVTMEVFCPIPVCGAFAKDNTQKLNNALIFDLFMNYEITQRNGNLATIVDFFPAFNSSSNHFRSIRIESNIGGRDNICNFKFNENGTLETLSYEIRDMIFNYEFNYKENRLESVSIGGEKKIFFNYDKNGKLQTITRLVTGRSWECNFNYIKGENKAEIKNFVIIDGKRNANPEEYFVSWNNQFKLVAYSLEVYASKDMKYTKEGNLISYSFNTVNKDNNLFNWEYSFDSKGNWIERKIKDEIIKRIIEYK